MPLPRWLDIPRHPPLHPSSNPFSCVPSTNTQKERPHAVLREVGGESSVRDVSRDPPFTEEGLHPGESTTVHGGAVLGKKGSRLLPLPPPVQGQCGLPLCFWEPTWAMTCRYWREAWAQESGGLVSEEGSVAHWRILKPTTLLGA